MQHGDLRLFHISTRSGNHGIFCCRHAFRRHFGAFGFQAAHFVIRSQAAGRHFARFNRQHVCNGLAHALGNRCHRIGRRRNGYAHGIALFLRTAAAFVSTRVVGAFAASIIAQAHHHRFLLAVAAGFFAALFFRLPLRFGNAGNAVFIHRIHGFFGVLLIAVAIAQFAFVAAVARFFFRFGGRVFRLHQGFGFGVFRVGIGIAAARIFALAVVGVAVVGVAVVGVTIVIGIAVGGFFFAAFAAFVAAVAAFAGCAAAAFIAAR